MPWKRLPPLPAPRFGGGLALLDGVLHFASGGTVDGSRAGGHADAFTADHDQHWALSLADPTRGWRARAAVPVRANHMAAATLGSHLYLLGGQSRGAECCSPALATERSTFAAVVPMRAREAAVLKTAGSPRVLVHQPPSASRTSSAVGW